MKGETVRPLRGSPIPQVTGATPPAERKQGPLSQQLRSEIWSEEARDGGDVSHRSLLFG